MSKSFGVVPFTAVVFAASSACGARTGIELEPTGSDAGMDGPTIPDALVFQDTRAIDDAPEEASIVDASADASSALGCPPADGQSYGCAYGFADGVTGPETCMIFVTAGACLPPEGGVPDADILSWTCVPSGSLNWLNMYCTGNGVVEVHYDPNTNQAIWAVCEW
jgi:hypothetical protein